METIDLSGKVKNLIRFGLITLLALSGAIGYAVFNHYHATTHVKITDAKINGTMLSVRALANGKVKELPFADGDEVQAGDVIAKIEVSGKKKFSNLKARLSRRNKIMQTFSRGKW